MGSRVVAVFFMACQPAVFSNMLQHLIMRKLAPSTHLHTWQADKGAWALQGSLEQKLW